MNENKAYNYCQVVQILIYKSYKKHQSFRSDLLIYNFNTFICIKVKISADIIILILIIKGFSNSKAKLIIDDNIILGAHDF